MDDHVYQDLPPKLSQIIDDGWLFPTDYPVVDNTHSPDATRLLKAVIAFSLESHYMDHRICAYSIPYFTQRLTSRLYNKMAQHQYWIDQYITLVADNQFFYNEEWQDGGTHTVETNGRTTNSTNSNTAKVSDTPQNSISDLNNYLSNAQVDSGTENGNESGEGDTQFTTDLHIKKSTLGDITVQFRNFAEFPNFIDQLIVAVAPCFIEIYNSEDIDYGTTV